VARIRACLEAGGASESAGTAKGEPGDAKAIRIVYVAPWDESQDAPAEGVDWVFSQAVLEHVEDIRRVYQALNRWLKPGAFMSHTIDFKSHGLTRHWHGHWTVPERTWKMVRGRRLYLINRLPRSAHLREIVDAGFQIVSETKCHSQPLSRGRLAFGREWFTEEDLGTSGSFVLAVKPA
jgi:SAM-dependent methyltransferase